MGSQRLEKRIKDELIALLWRTGTNPGEVLDDYPDVTIPSNPPSGYCRITNLYVLPDPSGDPEKAKLIAEWDDVK
jgi:hypothetical protein